MTVLGFAGFELDDQRAELRCPDGEVVSLRPKSFAMLSMFAANARRILTKQELMQAVWRNIHVSDDSLFQCIRELRVALGDDDRTLIRLVSRRGYVFEADCVLVRSDDEAAAVGIEPAAQPEGSPGSIRSSVVGSDVIAGRAQRGEAIPLRGLMRLWTSLLRRASPSSQ